MTTNFIDVCCGCGGLSLGLIKAGIRPIVSVDNDSASLEVYKKNVDEKIILSDIKKFRPTEKTDILVGGLPCQGFSTLGKRNVKDERNYLWVEFIRLLKETEATAFLFENVPDLLKTFHFKKFYKEAEKLGYKINYDVLNALDYGVAQNRRRAIIIGSLNNTPRMPKKKRKRKTVRDAIGDLSIIPDGKKDHCSRNATELSLERYKHIPPGGNRFNLPKRLQPPCWRKLKRGASNMFGRLEWDKPSGTIRTTFLQPECGRYLHPEANRSLTIREGARLQGFPDSFVFKGSSRQKAKMIGNAVPVPLAKEVGKAIVSYAL